MSVFSASDATLVRRVLSGQPQAFETLVLRNVRKAHAVARAAGLEGDDVEDAVQEGFLRAFRHLHSLENRRRFVPWLLGIVRNVARKELARKDRVVSSSTRRATDEARATRPDDLDARDFREYLWARVAELPDEVREAIFLYYHEGESIQSVARSVGISASGVKKRLRRGREVLRERLWRELEGCLRDMLPSTREWKRKAGRLALLVSTSLPVGWAARLRAARGATRFSVDGPSTAASVAGLGGTLMSAKKFFTTVVAIVLLLLAVPTWLAVRERPIEESEQGTTASSASSLPPAGPAPVQEATVSPPAAETRAEVEPSVDPRGRIVVVVLDPDGNGVQGAEVVCEGPTARASTTDGQGTVTLDRLALGEYALDIAATGLGRERLEEIDLAPDATEASIEIALTPACTIRGRVRTPDGSSVEGCEFSVFLRSEASDRPWKRRFRDVAVSDARGEFVLEDMPFGSYYPVEARKDGFETKIRRLATNLFLARDELSFDTGRVLDVLVLAYPPATVEGTVVAQGRFVEGARVSMRRTEAVNEELEAFFKGTETATSDAEGAFRLQSCVPGAYEVRVSAPGLETLVERIEVPSTSETPDGGSVLYDFELSPGGSLGGWLTRNGNGIRGWVHLFRRHGPSKVEFQSTAQSAPDGRFFFSDRLEDGEYVLAGFAEDHPVGRSVLRKRFGWESLPGEVDVSVEGTGGPRDVLVEAVSGEYRVSGVIVDTAGRPVPSAQLHMRFEANGLVTEGSATAATGEFDFAALPAGTLRLQVNASGFGSRTTEVPVGSGGSEPLVVELDVSRTFRAVIDYADGEPDSLPEIDLERKTEAGWRYAQRSGRPGVGIEAGVFEAENLPAGIYRARGIFRDHAETVSPAVDLETREVGEVVLRVEVGETLLGSIVFDDAELAARARSGRVLAQLHYSDGVRAAKLVRLEGSSYRIEHLRRGQLRSIRLQCDWEDADGARQTVLSELLPGLRIAVGENVADLGPVREHTRTK